MPSNSYTLLTITLESFTSSTASPLPRDTRQETAVQSDYIHIMINSGGCTDEQSQR